VTTAKFTINGTPSSPRGFDATNGQVLTLQLETNPAPDVYQTVYSLYNPSDPAAPLASKSAPVLTTTPSSGQPTVPTGAVTVPMPASGVHSFAIRCVVNGGRETATGRVRPEWTYERIVSIRSGNGQRKQLPGESTQYGDRGWSDAQNEGVDAVAGTALPPTAVADTASLRATLMTSGQAFSVLTPPSGPWVFNASDGAGVPDDDESAIKPNQVALVSSPGRVYNGGATSAATIAALRLMSSGKQRRTRALCYSTLGDGGGGEFTWNASNNNTTRPDDGGIVIVPTALVGLTGCWERQFTGEIRAAWFGARPTWDAVTNPATALPFDNYAAFTAATSYLKSKGGGKLRIASSPLAYYFATGFDTWSFIEIVGDGPSTVLACWDNLAAPHAGQPPAIVYQMGDLGAGVFCRQSYVHDFAVSTRNGAYGVYSVAAVVQQPFVGRITMAATTQGGHGVGCVDSYVQARDGETSFGPFLSLGNIRRVFRLGRAGSPGQIIGSILRIASIDKEGGTSPVGKQITGATNATPIVIQTAAAHGYTTGATVYINGIKGNTAANTQVNTPWTITVVDATHFSLNGSVGNGTYDASQINYGYGGGWAFPALADIGRAITNIVAGGSGQMRVTCTAHGRATGDVIYIADVAGIVAANGPRRAVVIDANTFDLTVVTPTYAASVYTWAYVAWSGTYTAATGRVYDHEPYVEIANSFALLIDEVCVEGGCAMGRYAMGCFNTSDVMLTSFHQELLNMPLSHGIVFEATRHATISGHFLPGGPQGLQSLIENKSYGIKAESVNLGPSLRWLFTTDASSQPLLSDVLAVDQGRNIRDIAAETKGQESAQIIQRYLYDIPKTGWNPHLPTKLIVGENLVKCPDMSVGSLGWGLNGTGTAGIAVNTTGKNPFGGGILTKFTMATTGSVVPCATVDTTTAAASRFAGQTLTLTAIVRITGGTFGVTRATPYVTGFGIAADNGDLNWVETGGEWRILTQRFDVPSTVTTDSLVVGVNLTNGAAGVTLEVAAMSVTNGPNNVLHTNRFGSITIDGIPIIVADDLTFNGYGVIPPGTLLLPKTTPAVGDPLLKRWSGSVLEKLGGPYLHNTFGWTPGTVAAGAPVVLSVSFPGAAFGMCVEAAWSVAIPDGLQLYASVVSAGNVKLTFVNHNTAGSTSIASGTAYVVVRDRRS